MLGPIYTPPIVKDTGGKLGTIQLPGAGGGANWMGGVGRSGNRDDLHPFDHQPVHFVAGAGRRPFGDAVHRAAAAAGTPTSMGSLPLIKGPYGRITAINLNTGDQAWMIPNGKPPDNIVNNPALKAAGIDASNWGGGQRSPILVTKTMLVEGSDDLRSIDKKTGAIIYEMPLGAQLTGGTMTYLMNGRQFIVAVVNGTQGGGAELVGLAVGQPAAAVVAADAVDVAERAGGRGAAPPPEN